MQEMMARMKAQMGRDIPAEIMDRLKSRLPDMAAEAEKQLVSTTTQQIAYAVLQTMLNKDFKFRSSRVDDVGKSPLPDWLDIGIASYASGAPVNVAYLQQHMDQTFPMEDVIAMSRPFMASSSDQGGGSRGGHFKPEEQQVPAKVVEASPAWEARPAALVLDRACPREVLAEEG